LKISIIIKSPGVRLNLVDFHRELFYDKIEDYDLFIYTEDDIRITPKTVHAYIEQTKNIEQLVGKSPAEDFNVGIVRYEYNYPPDVVIDDKTRHATANVTRVYWEHSNKPLVPKSFTAELQQHSHPSLAKNYVEMVKHHQGMFLATRDLLKAWRDRPGCNFHVIRQRPGMANKPSQPSEGTQRVWMSSNMLYGSRHCNVQQVLPRDKFGQLNVMHVPNKNYRRVGKKGRLGGAGSDIENEFGKGDEKFEGPSSQLVTAMEVHLAMRKRYPVNSGENYTGIVMIDEVDYGKRFKNQQLHRKLLDNRMKAFRDYVTRGGKMSDSDFNDWNWIV